MAGMRILFALQEFPYPPTNGVRLKVYNLLSVLARRHECLVLSFANGQEAKEAWAWCDSLGNCRLLGLFQKQAGVSLAKARIDCLARGYPLSFARWRRTDFALALERAVATLACDVVHFDMINMAQYSGCTERIPKVLSINDDVADRYVRMGRSAADRFHRAYYRMLAWQFIAFDKKMCSSFDAIHVVSEEERLKILKRTHTSNLAVIGLSVGHDSRVTTERETEVSWGKEGSPALFTAGNLFDGNACSPLLEFCTRGLPKVKEKWPGASLTIVARGVPVVVAKTLTACPGVTLLEGTEHYGELLTRADVALFLDTIGSGVKTRVLEALAAGKAVVGTECALEGIPVENRGEAFIVQSGVQASEVVCMLLENDTRREVTGRRAKAFATERYSLEGGAKKWEELYRHVLAIKRG